MTVVVEEFYKTNRLPLEDYDQFAAVINAAADFNKVRLVFRPL